MGLSIKNEEVERLARELATRRNVSITEAIRQSLAEEVRRENVVREAATAPGPRSERFERMMAIAREVAALPTISDLTDDEILGYDEFGVPELPKSMR
jgi:antitoxin VapB